MLPWDGVEERVSRADSSSRPIADDVESGIRWSTEIEDEPEPLALVRPVCGRCFIELPASLVCGFC